MGVMLFLGFFFVRRYGPRACLVRLFWGYTILFVPSGILALAAPAAAFQALPSGGLQLRVDWITLGVGQVAALAIILLLTIALPIPRVFYPILFALYVAILVLSYTRSAYLCLFAFVVPALVRENEKCRAEKVRVVAASCSCFVAADNLLPRIGMLILVRETETLGNLTGAHWPLGLPYRYYANTIALDRSGVLHCGTGLRGAVQYLVGDCSFRLYGCFRGRRPT